MSSFLTSEGLTFLLHRTLLQEAYWTGMVLVKHWTVWMIS
ncbi:hypothetical protein OIU76_017587 [Salix suchowensis]|nr:hypothetical protein OIU76_017587 [Salix suchowensis]